MRNYMVLIYESHHLSTILLQDSLLFKIAKSVYDRKIVKRNLQKNKKKSRFLY